MTPIVRHANHALSHEENRSKICFLCFEKKTNVYEIQGALKNNLKELVKCDDITIYFKNNRLPKVLCGTCRKKVYANLSLEPCQKINLPDFSRFEGGEIASEGKCQCHLCFLAREIKFPGISSSNNNETIKFKKSKFNLKKIMFKRCNNCLSIIKRGIRHDCNSRTKIQNVQSLCNDKEKQQLTSTLIHEMKNCNLAANKDPNVINLTNLNGGRPMRVTVNSKLNSSKKSVQISAENFSKIKTRFNLSAKTSKGLAGALRAATKNRKLIEPGVRESIQLKSRSVTPYFDKKIFNFVNIKSKVVDKSPKVVVFCKDLEGFIARIEEQRNVGNSHLKFGIDGGKGFLKICLSVQAINDDEINEGEIPCKRQRYV